MKDAYPILPPKEYKEARVAELLSAIHSVSNPAIPFNPSVFEKDFGLENILSYLWCDVALLVGTKQELWEKYQSLVPSKIRFNQSRIGQYVWYPAGYSGSVSGLIYKDNFSLHSFVIKGFFIFLTY